MSKTLHSFSQDCLHILRHILTHFLWYYILFYSNKLTNQVAKERKRKVFLRVIFNQTKFYIRKRSIFTFFSIFKFFVPNFKFATKKNGYFLCIIIIIMLPPHINPNTQNLFSFLKVFQYLPRGLQLKLCFQGKPKYCEIEICLQYILFSEE